MSTTLICTIECEAAPVCTVCNRKKSPVGRDVASAMSGSYCEHKCSGYGKAPFPGHLWPGELARSVEDAS